MSESSRCKSQVWQYFKPTDDNKAATCNSCGKTFKRPSGNTTNLIGHLEQDHRNDYMEMRQEEKRRKLEQETLEQVRVCLSFCLSDCLSVTFMDHVKTNKHIFYIFSPSGSQAVLELFVWGFWSDTAGDNRRQQNRI